VGDDRAGSGVRRQESGLEAGPVVGEPWTGERWEDVDVLAYKAEGSAPFRDVTRQVLFDDDRVGAQLRYFEVSPAGWTTLERHEHVHNVVVLRGHGQCLVGDVVSDIGEHDLVEVPPMAWHQFRAAPDAPLGFLCLVRQDRDRPQLPDASTRARLSELFRGP
jgi:mannose-6-phosphate isomerase-like protein (cupin superfamily)